MLAAVLIEVIVVSGGIVPHAGGCVDGDGKRWNCTTFMTYIVPHACDCVDGEGKGWYGKR